MESRKNFPNCQRAVNRKTAAGIAIKNPTNRAAFHGPGRKATAEMAISTMQNCRMKSDVIFPLPETEVGMGAISRIPGECYG